MFRSILIPLDSSSFGEYALPLAVSLARRAGSTLQLVHVHVPLAPMDGGTALTFENRPDAALRQSEQNYLDRVAGQLKGTTRVTVQTAVLEGPVAEVLDERARSTGADLIIMTTHGRGMLARAWLGSVADELVRRTTVPLLLVRPQDAKLDLSQEAAPLPRVLIPLDGSPFAEKIIEPAVGLGQLMNAEYDLVRVIRPAVVGGTPGHVPAEVQEQKLLFQLEDLHKRDQLDARVYLDRIAQRFRERHLTVHSRVLVHDQPAVAILDEARSQRAELIALATHGRGGLPRLWLGSVADKVLRGSATPVLLLRPASA